MKQVRSRHSFSPRVFVPLGSRFPRAWALACALSITALAAAAGADSQNPRSGRASWLAGHHHPAGMRSDAGRRAGTGQCQVRGRCRDGPDERAGTTDHELLLAERNAALREALMRMPPGCQRLIAMLIQDPPMPYAKISAELGIPVGSIGPSRRRCLEKLRRDPAVAALIDAEAGLEQQPNGRWRERAR